MCIIPGTLLHIITQCRVIVIHITYSRFTGCTQLNVVHRDSVLSILCTYGVYKARCSPLKYGRCVVYQTYSILWDRPCPVYRDTLQTIHVHLSSCTHCMPQNKNKSTNTEQLCVQLITTLCVNDDQLRVTMCTHVRLKWIVFICYVQSLVYIFIIVVVFLRSSQYYIQRWKGVYRTCITRNCTYNVQLYTRNHIIQVMQRIRCSLTYTIMIFVSGCFHKLHSARKGVHTIL